MRMKNEVIKMKKCGVTNPAKNYVLPNITGNDEFNVYLKKVNSEQNLSAQEEKILAIKAKAGDLKARHELIKANLKLVITIARKVIHVSKLPVADLIQEGNIGLMVAVEKFNPELGYRFSTYATWWIKQAMFKALSEQSYCMKIPVYVQETLSKFSKVKAEMERKTSNIVTISDVAEKMEIEPAKIDSYLSAFNSPISLDGNIENKDGNETTYSEIIADESVSVEENLEYEELKKEITNVISTLKEREQIVIKMRFGLENAVKTTLEDIGKMFGVTKECIRQTEARALNKMKINLAY